MDSSMKLLELLVIAGGTLWYRTFFRFYWMPITNFRIVTSYSKLSLKRWQRDIHGRILSIESRWPNEQRYGIKVRIQCRSVLRGVVPFGVKKSLANMPEKSPQYWHPLIFAFLYCLIFTYLYFFHYHAKNLMVWCSASFCFNYTYIFPKRGIVFASSRRDRYGCLNGGVETSKPSSCQLKKKHFLMMGNPCFNVMKMHKKPPLKQFP